MQLSYLVEQQIAVSQIAEYINFLSENIKPKAEGLV